MRKQLLLVLALALIGIGGGWLYSEWTKSPEYSLRQAKNAYERNDVNLFLRYVDVHTATETAVDAIFEASLDGIVNDEKNANSELVAALAGDYLDLYRSKTIEYAREELLSEVEGRSASRPLRAQLLGHSSVKLKKSYVRKEDGYAYIGVEKNQSELPVAIPLEFKLRELDGYWQVVELSNLTTVINVIAASRKANSIGTREPIGPLITNLGSTGEWFYSEWTKSPEYSLLQLKTAIDTNDAVLFERHCDVNSLIRRAVDVAMELAVAEISKSTDPSDAFAGAMALGFIQLMKPTLIEYARDQLLMHIEGRSPPPVAMDANKTGPEMALDGLFKNAGDKIRNASVQRDGSVAFFVVDTYNEKSKSKTNWHFKLRDVGGYWQVVELANLRALMDP